MPNLRDTEKYRDTIWDFTPFNGLFAHPKIKIGDIDGAVMWKGELLIVEFKSPHATSIDGQQLLFGRLLMRGNCTILLVEGETNEPKTIQIGSTFGVPGDQTKSMKKVWSAKTPCDMAHLQYIIDLWSVSADANPEYGYVPTQFFPDLSNAPSLVNEE